jgi:DNA polymerase-3 subunit alpha
MALHYIDVKHGRRPKESYHPIVDEYTDWTYGQIIYQEQVLRIIRELGGFPMTRVHAIRQIISQKLGEAQFESMYKEFEENACASHGCSPAQARKIWRFMATSATYSFNVAHCISYSMLAFWQMWLKVYHPTAFYAAQLRKISDDVKRNRLLKDADRHGIKLSPMEIRACGESWTAQSDGSIMAGLLQIPKIGPVLSRTIVDWISERPVEDYLSWGDIIAIKGIGPKTANNVFLFATDPDPFNLTYISRVMQEIRVQLKPGNKWYLPIPTHTSDSLPKKGTHQVTWVGIPVTREYKDLIEDERARTGKSVEEILATVKDPELKKSCTLKCIDDGDEEVYLRFDRWHYPKFAAKLESIRLGGPDAVIVQGRKREGFGVFIQTNELWAIELD